MRRFHLALAALLIALLALPAAAGAIELGQGTKPRSLVFGPDGNLWFTADKWAVEGFTNVVGRTTLAGEVREFSLPKRNSVSIGDIAVGPDGNLWFADTAVDAIGRVNLEGQVTEFPLTSGSAPTGLVAGPDGAIWFVETGAGQLGRIEMNGSVTTIPLPVGAHPLDLAFAEGAFWVTESGRNAIARVTLDGAVAELPLVSPNGKPKAIVRDASGALWFSEEGGARLGRFYPNGAIAELPVPGNAGGTGALAAGPDGSIFFTTGSEHAWTEVGSISPSEELSGLGCVSPICDLPVTALTVGPEGDLWYGTGIAYYGGGGGGALMQPYFPGVIDRFEPPTPVAVTVRRVARRVRGRLLYLDLVCRSPANAKCVGNASLEARIPRPFGHGDRRFVSLTSYFRLAAGERQRISLQIAPFAMDILRRRQLRATLRTVLHGGFETSRRLTLRLPRHRPKRSR